MSSKARNHPTCLQQLTGILLITALAVTNYPLNAVAQDNGPVSLRQTNAQPPSDAFREDWVPPAPVLTPADIQVNKAAKGKRRGPKLSLDLDETPTVGELEKSRALGVGLRRRAGRDSNPGQNRALAVALRKYVNEGGRHKPGNFRHLEKFLEQHPDTAFAVSLHQEAAENHWRHARFSAALNARRAAWDAIKDSNDPGDRQLLGRVLGEYLEALSRMGQVEELRAVLAAVEGRQLNGRGTDAVFRAKVGLAHFETQPEQNVFCGFTAANTICTPRGHRPIFPDVHDEEEKIEFIENGLSLFELRAHSHEAGGDLRIVRRTRPNAEIPVPSIIHWKFDHYSALTETNEDGQIRVEDFHLKYNAWVDAETLRTEGTGYFLVPGDVELPRGYEDVDDATAKTLFGRHCSHEEDEEEPDCPREESGGNTTCPIGMTTYSFATFAASLLLSDTPIQYSPPFGPRVSVQIQYDERSSVIDELNAAGNFGPRWSHNYRGYIEFLGTGTPNTAVRMVRGNGTYADYDYHSGSGAYQGRYADMPDLIWLAAGQGGPGYQLTFPDGGKLLYTQPDGPSPDKYLLTSQIDPFGNALTLTYDADLRLDQIVDPLGQATTFSYTVPGGSAAPTDQDLVFSITDPFNRTATFDYDALGRLTKIVDPAGIESSLVYDGADFPQTLTTPYGVTTFDHGLLAPPAEFPGGIPGRWVEVTGPGGDRERIERNENTDFPATGPDELPLNESPMAPTSVDVAGTAVPFLPKNNLLKYRNTYFWDREQMPHEPDGAGNLPDPDYADATIYNWLADNNTIVSTLASVKRPLTGRVWFNYPGQVSEHAPGTVSRPSKTVRYLENPDGTASWAMSQALYNTTTGKPTEQIDPLGRKTRYQYTANGIDVTSLEVYEGGAWKTAASFSNFLNRLPRTYTNASGVVTTLTLNARGQVTQKVTSKGGESRTEARIYDPNGYLTTIQVNGGVVATFTYDSAGRARTVTDATGYTLTYDYDNLDRVTLVTHPDGSTEQAVYEAHSVTSQKDRDDRWSRFTYTPLRQVRSIQDPKGQVTAYEWCRCGDLKKLVDPKGQITEWVRDLRGRVLEKRFSDGNKYTYVYEDYSGRLKSATYPKDIGGGSPTITFGYHLDGKPAVIDYSDPTMADVSYAYNDDLGRVSVLTDGEGSTVYAYHPITSTVNGAGALSAIDGPWANDTISYTYDEFGRLKTREVLDDGGAVLKSETIDYDSMGRRSQVVDELGTHTMSYDGNSNRPLNSQTLVPGQSTALISRSYSWQTPAQGGRLNTLNNGTSNFSYNYSPAGRITSWNRNLGGTVDNWTLEYDPVGQMTELSESTKDWRWSYDAAGNRVSEIEGGSLRHAGIGEANRLERIGGSGKTQVEGTVDEPATVTVNGQSAQMRPLPGGSGFRFSKEVDLGEGQKGLEIAATDANGNVNKKGYTVSVSGVERTLEYDDNGNITREIVAGGPTRTYEWDSINRLTAIQEGIAWRTEFTYNGQSRRIRIVEKTWVAGSASWAVDSDYRYLWDGKKISQKRNSVGDGVVANYYHNGEQRIDGGGTDEYYYTRDHLGSIREVIAIDGSVAARFDYSAWGERTRLSGTTELDWGFTGHHFHEKSALHLTLFRVYSPDLGRWLSPDPIGELGGINLYGYVENDPVRFWDLLGLCKKYLERGKEIQDKIDILRETIANLSDPAFIDDMLDRPSGLSLLDRENQLKEQLSDAWDQVDELLDEMSENTKKYLACKRRQKQKARSKGRWKSIGRFMKRFGRRASGILVPFVVPPGALPPADGDYTV